MIAVTVFTTPVLAATSTDSVTTSYTYWLGYKEKTFSYCKPMYEVETVLTGNDFGYKDFNKPSDIFLSEDNKLYIVENGSSRLTIWDSNYNVVGSITAFIDSNGEKYEFLGSEGVFVTKEGEIYIADKSNKRILVGKEDGTLIEEHTLPETALIPSDFIYQPTRVVVDDNGFMYVISNGSTYGALLLTPNGEFQGFYGANKVKTDIASTIKTLWKDLFATNEQLQGQVQKIPFQFTDICIDQNDFTYTVTGITDMTDDSQTGQIRCLNPKGKTILTVKETEKYVNTDAYNFGDIEVAENNQGTGLRLQNFVSVDVDTGGYIYALDQTYGRIYVYDSECNLLNAFGGGVGVGTQSGTFENANSITVNNDRIYVSDNTKNSITVFKLNDYGKTLKEADTLYIKGEYERAKGLWETVNKIDPNCQLAYHGLAKAYLIEKDYERALQYSEEGLDYSTYNQAFTYARTGLLKDSFKLTLVIIVILIALIIAFFVIKKKKNWKFYINHKFKVYITSFLHPFEFANAIKFQNKGSLLLAVISLILFYAFEVLGITNGGFIFSKFDVHSYNSFYTLLSTVGLVILWSLCYWAVAVLLSGKCKLKEVFIVSSYAMLPQIFNAIFYLIASNVLVFEEATAITVVGVITLILSGIMLCIGCMVCSEFSFFKFVGVTIISVLAMCLVVFVIFMVLTLDQQLIVFIQSVLKEIVYR